MPQEQEQVVKQELVVEQEVEVAIEPEPETNPTPNEKMETTTEYNTYEPNEKMITTTEYNIYELQLWGGKDGLQELSDLKEGLENKQNLTQASLIMRAVGVTHDNDDEDVWWSTCGVMEGDGYFSLVIYEYIKCKFTVERLSRVVSNLKNANSVDSGIGWELFQKKVNPSKN